MRMAPVLFSVLFALSGAEAATSQTLREQFKAQRQEKMLARLEQKKAEESRAIDLQAISPGASKTTLAYGSDAMQAVDVYRPANARNAPVIVMVHGGAWKIGDKANTGSVENKLKHWLPKGYVLVSVNYRLLPQADAYAQADDIAAAIAFVERNASGWGADASRLILMGHSAGAHLVALNSADPSGVIKHGGQGWVGTVVLDSATMDLEATMTQKRVPGFYTEAFGADPKRWPQASPLKRLTPQAVPMMIVCSTRRPDKPCDQAETFSSALKRQGMPTPVQKENKTHSEINKDVGTPGPYTAAIDAFIAARLAGHK